MISGNIAGLTGNIDGLLGTDSGLLTPSGWDTISIYPQDMIINPSGGVYYSYSFPPIGLFGMAFPTGSGSANNIRSHLTLPTSKFLSSVIYPYVRYIQVNNDTLSFVMNVKYIWSGNVESPFFINYADVVYQPEEIYYPYTSGTMAQIIVFSQLPTFPIRIEDEPVGSLLEIGFYVSKPITPYYDVLVLELGFIYKLNTVGSSGIRQK